MESKQEEKFVLKQAAEDAQKKEEAIAEGEPKTHSHAKPATAPKAEKAKEAPKAKEEKKEEKKREIVLERVYTVPLLEVLKKPRMRRQGIQSRVLRDFVSKHMKAPIKLIKINTKVAEQLTHGGDRKTIGKIKVKCSKDKQGLVLVEQAA